MPTDPSDRPMDRRRFFREGLREFLRPLAGAIAPLENALKQFETQSTPASAPPSPASRRHPVAVWQRPPGALPETKFRETCSKCGDCVRVCPVHAIKLDAQGVNGGGVPYIDPETSACVLCDGLHCMNTCPTGALVPMPLTDIDMGTAVWHQDTCTRAHGEDCTLCVDKCPLGTAAISLGEKDIEVHPLVCNGCGVCQQYCPTSPKSITVIPIAMRQH